MSIHANRYPYKRASVQPDQSYIQAASNQLGDSSSEADDYEQSEHNLNIKMKKK